MYDFPSPKQKTAIGSQETEPKPSDIIQIDQNLPGTRLDRLITEKMAQILNAMPDASDRRDHRGRQIRAQRREEGVQGRPLRTQAHCQGRQARAEGAETQGHPVRVRGDRMLPAAHGAFHAQRALEDAAHPQGMGVRRYLNMSQLDDNLVEAN